MAQTPAIALLERQGIPHRIIQFDAEGHAGHYGRSAASVLKQDEDQVFKTLMVTLDKQQLVVAMVPVSHQLDLKAVAKALGGRKAQMAPADLAQRTTGYVVGGISPLGQKKRLPSVIDASALQHAEIFISGGKRGLEIAIAPDALVALLSCDVSDIASDEH